MSDPFDEIPAYIDKTLSILSQLIEKLDNFESVIVPKIGENSSSILIPAQLLESGYTAAETLFMRISQAFENHLTPDRWHTDLLEKMILEIESIRPRVLSQPAYTRLNELMRFRHFKRYYFELEYDRRKIDFLVQIFREVVPLLRTDLEQFSEKLKAARK